MTIHGTNGAFYKHKRTGTPACPACYEAHADYVRACHIKAGSTSIRISPETLGRLLISAGDQARALSSPDLGPLAFEALMTRIGAVPAEPEGREALTAIVRGAHDWMFPGMDHTSLTKAVVDALISAGVRGPVEQQDRSRAAWEAFRDAYFEYQRQNPGWQAFWTDHHTYAFNAALVTLRGDQS